jgi:pimeloyl-ACP methyl ester carboxylesterase
LFSESRLQVGDRWLNVAVGPQSGPPLLLLHGVLRRWRDFSAVLPALSCGWHLHGLDFRGHGESSPTPGRYRAIDYVDDAVAVLEQQFDEPAVLFGHSLGAMVATATAAKCPGKVRAVVLEDPPFATMGERIDEAMLMSLFAGFRSQLEPGLSVSELARRLASIRLDSDQSDAQVLLGDVRDPAALRHSAACLLRIDPEVLIPIVERRWLEGYDLAGYLPQLCCPVLLLRADIRAGGMLTKADADRFDQVVADCSSIYFPRVGHLIHSTATQELLAVVLCFLESLR